jgi:hypothetical protein
MTFGEKLFGGFAENMVLNFHLRNSGGPKREEHSQDESYPHCLILLNPIITGSQLLSQYF